jgi:hypothetical protein
LAIEFCKKHNLKPEMKSRLIPMLEDQIKGVLPKIVEGDDADDSDQNQEQ